MKSRRGYISFNLTPESATLRERAAQMTPPQPTVRQWLARGLLPGGLRPNRQDIAPARMLELIDRYPGLYRHADSLQGEAPPFAREAFAVGGGWLGIVERLSARLATDPNLVVGQLKEKMGRLTVYLERTSSPEVEAATDAALDEARAESERTCEICGEPGVLEARIRGWVSVRCEPCEALDVAVEACRELAAYAAGLDLAAFEAGGESRSPELLLSAAKLHLVRLGGAAERQPAGRRALLPGVEWARLDLFRDILGYVKHMTAAEVWYFVRDKLPALEEALR